MINDEVAVAAAAVAGYLRRDGRIYTFKPAVIKVSRFLLRINDEILWRIRKRMDGKSGLLLTRRIVKCEIYGEQCAV